MIAALSILTAFLSSRILLASAECLPGPSLSKSPLHLVNVRGESVTLTCAAPEVQRAQSSQNCKKALERNSKEETSEEKKGSNGSKTSEKEKIKCKSFPEGGLLESSYTDLGTRPAEDTAGSYRYVYFTEIAGKWKIFNKINLISANRTASSEYAGQKVIVARINVTDSRNYSCAYLVKTSETWICSSRSNSVSILVADHPPSPSFSVSSQYPVYIRGESVNITCSVAEGHTATKFIIYSQAENHQYREVASKNSSMFTLSTAHLGPNGSYSCAYTVMVSGRVILSISSNSAPIFIIDPLSAPEFSLQPPDGGVNEEGVLLLNCTAPEIFKKVTMHFMKGSEILHTESTNGSGSSISFSYRPSPGNISCYYEVEVKGRTLHSPTSNTTLTYSGESGLGIWLYYIFGGSLFFILILVFLIYRLFASREGRIFSFSSSPVQSPKDVTTSLAMSTARSNCSSPRGVKDQHLYCEPDSLQPAPALYSTVNAPQPPPPLYSTVNAPQSAPALYSTVNASQPPPPLYSTVNAPQPAPPLC